MTNYALCLGAPMLSPFQESIKYTVTGVDMIAGEVGLLVPEFGIVTVDLGEFVDNRYTPHLFKFVKEGSND